MIRSKYGGFSAGSALILGLAMAGCGGAATPAEAPTPRASILPAEPAPIPAGQAPTAGEYAQAPDIGHYDIEIALPPLGGPIAATATLELSTPEGATSTALDLTGLLVTAVEVDDQPTTYRQADGKVHVDLPAGSSQRRVTLRYVGTPDDGLIQQANVHGEASVFADNWPNRARFWFPSVDHPSDKATVKFTVHAPAPWSVIANGVQQGAPTTTSEGVLNELGFTGAADHRTWVWQSEVEISSYMMVIGAGPLVSRSGGTAACGNAPASPRRDGCIDVGYWVFPQDTVNAERNFRRSDQMIDFFTELIGPFPYEKLMNVQSSTRFGGMENASAIFYSENAIASGRNIEGTVSHEIAHQWFGDSATEAEWSHLWLSEGFATYFGALFFEHAEGVQDFRNRLEQNRQSYIGSSVVGQPIVSPNADLFALLNANNYPKGGWVLHMLRGVVGDQVFFEGIRTYYREFTGGIARSADFQEAMERVSSQDLDWFFDQWLYQPGYPIFELSWEFDEAAGEVRYRLEQTQDPSWPTFRTELELEAETPTGPVTHRVQVNARSVEGRFEVRGVATGLTVDPEGWVLKDVKTAGGG